MPDVPQEAVNAAVGAYRHALMDRPTPTALSDEQLMREVLEAAAPILAGAGSAEGRASGARSLNLFKRRRQWQVTLVLAVLAAKPEGRHVTEITEITYLTAKAVSTALARLKLRGLVTVEWRDGALYQVTEAGRKEAAR